MKTRGTQYVRTGPGEIEHTQATETETHCSDPLTVNFFLLPDVLQCEVHAPLQHRPVVEQRLH
jgi:hypothetical protein